MIVTRPDLNCDQDQSPDEVEGSLDFRTFDLGEADQRSKVTEALEDNVDLITCFTTMHWVSDQQQTFQFFR